MSSLTRFKFKLFLAVLALCTCSATMVHAQYGERILQGATPLSSQIGWSEWLSAPCFTGVEFQVAKVGGVQGQASSYDTQLGRIQWKIRFRNNLTSPIHFTFVARDTQSGEILRNNNKRTVSIKPGNGLKNIFYLNLDSFEQIFVNIVDVRIGSDTTRVVACYGGETK
jgi:hypothetical protein